MALLSLEHSKLAYRADFVPYDAFTAALTRGLLLGYQAYGVAHHGMHFWRFDAPWLRLLKRRHAIHHHGAEDCCYGVSSSLWDPVFGTLPTARGASAAVPPRARLAETAATGSR